MPCTPTPTPYGVAIVCTRGRRKVQRCECGRHATKLCDWKIPGGTCDIPLCERCTTVPAPDKDLCPGHAEEWEKRKK